jgi:FkbM family methyltransferase
MFSQNEEEKYILEYFGDSVGTFCSLGENDGVTFSNVRALVLRGWKGVMVDCSPTAVARCKELYKDFKGIYVYDYAIYKHNGKEIFQNSGALCTPSDTGLVGTFHQHEKARFDRKVKYDPIEVKTFRWKTALNRWKIKEFDFISLDIEGSELFVLPEMDLSKTRCICIEWNGKPELKEAYEKYLDGFSIIYTSGENIVYGR